MIVRQATLRLTFQYSVVILGIIAVFAFGVALYSMVAFDLALPEDAEGTVDQANATLRVGLIVCFATLVLIVPLVSFLLAQRSLAPVHASLEAQQRFVDDASHELRTPIAVAQGELELALLQPRSPEAYRAAMTAALAAIEELSVLSRDLLLLASADNIAGATEQVTFEAFGARVVQACPPSVRGRVHLETRGDGTIDCSAELLTRAVVNLVENAEKYSPIDTAIEVAVVGIAESVRITVTDHGIGMTTEEAAKAFERFWRADTARTTAGRGVGLSIVQRVAALHRGTVRLDTALGRGTVATLELPRAAA